MASYTGNIEISQHQRSDKSLSYYAVEQLEIKDSDWVYIEDEDVYRYVVSDYKKPFVTDIKEFERNKSVLVDVDYPDDDTVVFTAIHNDHVVAFVVFNIVPDNLSDVDIFYPATRGNVVKFNDGETLEMKYLNGDLTKFSPANPNLSSIRYIKKIKEETFIENKGRYSIVVYGREHKLGLNIMVQTILAQDPDTKIYRQIRDADIEIDNNKTYNEGTTVIVTFDKKFEGFMVLQKEKFAV